jgi:hypothetical protein
MNTEQDHYMPWRTSAQPSIAFNFPVDADDTNANIEEDTLGFHV